MVFEVFRACADQNNSDDDGGIHVIFLPIYFMFFGRLVIQCITQDDIVCLHSIELIAPLYG